jgi:hypothetical protein
MPLGRPRMALTYDIRHGHLHVRELVVIKTPLFAPKDALLRAWQQDAGTRRETRRAYCSSSFPFWKRTLCRRENMQSYVGYHQPKFLHSRR